MEESFLINDSFIRKKFLPNSLIPIDKIPNNHKKKLQFQTNCLHICIESRSNLKSTFKQELSQIIIIVVKQNKLLLDDL